MRKTKIICTLGPSVNSVEAISGLLRGGMNGARFNFSHGTHESHAETLGYFRQACADTGCIAAAILDTKGPEIRIRSFAEGKALLKEGERFTLRTDSVPGSAEEVSVTYENLNRELRPGCTVLIDDGLVKLTVEEIDGTKIRCRVITGGVLKNNKSINIPEIHIALPTLTDKDRDDLAFAVKNGFDYIAASFVRTAEDVRILRSTLDGFGGREIGIIAKIENQEGVDNMEEIIRLADGVMVARGDLGVEIPAERVPVVQKAMIRQARMAGKPVIIATQMLDSMIERPRPTRAEVSDVANAVYDKASCVMLSGETASGAYPQKSLEIMAAVLEEAEKDVYADDRFVDDTEGGAVHAVTDAITHTSCLMAQELKAKAIVTATQSGYTARMLARFRPSCRIVAATTEASTLRRMQLFWGVAALLYDSAASTDDLLSFCAHAAERGGFAKKGETVVITAGVPIGHTGTTNLLKAHILE